MDITPLLVIGTGVTVLGLSYMVGREHGRAQGERLGPGPAQFDVAQRIGAIEGSLSSLAGTVDGLLGVRRDHRAALTGW
jgi:hypothetical protein